MYTFNALIEATALNMNEKSEDKWNNILVRRNPHFCFLVGLKYLFLEIQGMETTLIEHFHGRYYDTGHSAVACLHPPSNPIVKLSACEKKKLLDQSL